MPLALTGGRFRGALLTTPSGKNLTRPTSGKVRQAVFNILRGRSESGEFLDLYAGSGAVGLEAVSRGFHKIVLVENHPDAFRALLQNRGRLEARGADAESMECRREEAMEFCRDCTRAGRRFAVVFADPPFSREFTDLWPVLAPLLTPEGAALIQFPSRRPPGWLDSATRVYAYGESSLALFAAGHF